MLGHSDGGFHFENLSNGWRVGRFAVLAELDSLVHAVTTRGGPAWSADADANTSRTAELAAALGLEQIATCRQVHGNTILHVETGGVAGDADGLVTNVPLCGLLGRSADCPLILTADQVSGAVGMAHASWRGVVSRVASQLVVNMAGRFDVCLDHTIACICPSAGPCCYEVGQDVVDAAVGITRTAAEQFFQTRGGKIYFDLWSAIAADLVRAGLAPENIHVAGICTICSGDLFPSFRVEGPGAARFAAVIAQR